MQGAILSVGALAFGSVIVATATIGPLVLKPVLRVLRVFGPTVDEPTPLLEAYLTSLAA